MGVYTEVFKEACAWVCNNFDRIFSYIVGIFGIISYVLARKSSKQDKNYEYLLKIADKHIEKELSDAEIAEAKEKIQRMHEDIKENLPVEAKRVVLENEYQSQLEQLYLQYENLQRIKEKLQGYPGDSKFESELEDIIKSETSLYKSKSKINLILICLFSLLLLNGMPGFFRYPIIIGTIYFISNELLYLLPSNLSERKIFIKNLLIKVLFMALFTYVVILWLGLIFYYDDSYCKIFNYTFEIRFVFSMYSFLPYMALIFAELSFRKKRTTLYLILSFLLSIISFGGFLWYSSLSRVFSSGMHTNFKIMSMVFVLVEVIIQVPIIVKTIKKNFLK